MAVDKTKSCIILKILIFKIKRGGENDNVKRCRLLIYQETADMSGTFLDLSLKK
jgi:hypothetical protein